MEEEEERSLVMRALSERLGKHDDNRRAAQDKLHEVCDEMRKQIDDFEDKINNELRELFDKEDNRLQTALNRVREWESAENDNFSKAKAELIVTRTYELVKYNCPSYEMLDFTKMYELKEEKIISPEVVCERKPTDVHIIGIDGGKISVDFTHITSEEEEVISKYAIKNQVKYKCILSKRDEGIQKGTEYVLNKVNDVFVFTSKTLDMGSTYVFRVKAALEGQEKRESEWSDEITEFTIQEFSTCCAWKKCPDYVNIKRKYFVDGKK